MSGEDSSGFLTNRERMLARLQKRHGVKERPCERDQVITDAGVVGRDVNALEFDRIFTPLVNEFNELLEQQADKGSLATVYAKMKNVTNERISSLPSYDARRAQQLLTDCRLKLDELDGMRQSAEQGENFTFRIASHNEAPEAADVPSVADASVGCEGKSNLCGLTNESRVFSTCHNEDVFFEKLVNCRISVTCETSTMHVANCERCTFVCAPTTTSVMVDNCRQCTLVVECQQLRMHDSQQITLYLTVYSAGIIEGCHDVRVAPNPMREPKGFNNWAHLKDFDWLSTKEQSPNWSLLPETERKSDWVF